MPKSDQYKVLDLARCQGDNMVAQVVYDSDMWVSVEADISSRYLDSMVGVESTASVERKKEGKLEVENGCEKEQQIIINTKFKSKSKRKTSKWD